MQAFWAQAGDEIESAYTAAIGKLETSMGKGVEKLNKVNGGSPEEGKLLKEGLAENASSDEVLKRAAKTLEKSYRGGEQANGRS